MIVLRIKEQVIDTYDDLIMLLQNGLSFSMIPTFAEKIRCGIVQKWIFQERQLSIDVDTEGKDDVAIIESFARLILNMPEYRIQFPDSGYYVINEVVLFLLQSECVLHFRYVPTAAVNVRCLLSIGVDNNEMIKDEFTFEDKEVSIDKTYGFSNTDKRIIIRINGESVPYSLYTTISDDLQIEQFWDLGKISENVFWKYSRKIKKWGLINSKGQIVLPFKYSDVSGFHQGLAKVKEGNEYFLINTQGERIIKYFHSDHFEPSEGMIGGDTLTGVLAFRASDFDELGPFSDGLAYVKKDNKYGFIDKNGTVVIDLQYQDANSFSEGLAAVRTRDKWGFIAPDGTIVIPFNLDDYLGSDYIFKEGYAAVQRNGVNGYIDKYDHFIACPYSLVFNFSDGYARVAKENEDGEWEYLFLDHNFHSCLCIKGKGIEVGDFLSGKAVVWGYDGGYIIDKIGEEIFRFKDGWICLSDTIEMNEVLINEKKGSFQILELTSKRPKRYLPSIQISRGLNQYSIYLNSDENYVIEPDTEEHYKCDDNFPLAPVLTDYGYRYIRPDGSVAFSESFEYATNFNDKFAIVVSKNNDMPYCINRRGEKLFDFPYDYTEECVLSDGRMPVRKDNLWGFIDDYGTLVIHARYEEVMAFSEGLAAVKSDGLWGYIDTDGNEICPFIYCDAGPFSEGVASVRRHSEDKISFVNKDFKTQISGIGYGRSRFSEGLAYFFDWKTKNGGFLNRDGNVVILGGDFSGRDFYCGLSCVYFDGKYGYIDKSGKWVIEPKYTYAGDFTNNAALAQDSLGIYVLRKEDDRIVVTPIKGFPIPMQNFPLISRFSKGLARVLRCSQREDEYDKYGFVDEYGRVAIPNAYYGAGIFM